MSLLQRLKEARIVRVLLVYLGASWVVVEAASLLTEELGLPDWVVPVTIILLLVGLVVVGATAWVQASPATDRREAAGEVPTDWELDLGGLARSLKGGELPHLTWGRAIAGGVIAFLALFGLASLLNPGDDGVVPELRADPAAPAVAVLPFRVSGPDLETWREGMVDLLSRNLDGIGGLRAIDSRTVLARWDELVAGDPSPDLPTALAVGERTGARWALVGSAVEVGPRVRVSADVYELEAGRRVDGVVVEGSPDSLFALVDGLSVDVARALLERDDPELSGVRLSSITTESPTALRRFLEGEAQFRRLAFREAVEVYEGAVERDPAFALAWFRLGSARGWLALGTADAARREAYEHRARLPDREALLVEAEYRARVGALPSGVALLREGVRRYPDDPEMWYQLGDVYIHWGPQLLVPLEEGERALERAVALDPGFAPFHIHLVELAIARGDSAEAARRLATEVELAGRDSRYVRSHQLLFDYVYGGPEARERVAAALDTLPESVFRVISAPISLDGAGARPWIELANRICDERVGVEPGTTSYALYNCFWTRITGGRIEDVRAQAARMYKQGSPTMASSVDFVLRQTGIDPDAPVTEPEAFLDAIARRPPSAAEGVIDPAYFTAGMAAIETGRTALADSLIQLYRDASAEREARGDTLDARIITGLEHGLLGLRALARERPDTALRRLQTALDLLAGSTGPEFALRTVIAWPLAELHARAGRHEVALRLYESLWAGTHAAPALLRRAEIHEELGQAERARELYAHFLALWADASPEHPLVQRARTALGPG